MDAEAARNYLRQYLPEPYTENKKGSEPDDTQ